MIYFTFSQFVSFPPRAYFFIVLFKALAAAIIVSSTTELATRCRNSFDKIWRGNHCELEIMQMRDEYNVM